MEEDGAVQAPVTRLRRRLSVEQTEDVNSPGPATPTKKRGARLAAKPQLELIDENSGSTSKRPTKKSAVKELVEVPDEKPLTPSRRSTRIKSNTSIVSENTQSYESPRARRAARRLSQVGSDNESTVTPVRQTRRIRKDSTSSNDKLEATLSSKPANITVLIIEEESNTQSSKVSTTTNDISDNQPLRKSPRLKEKLKKKEQGSKDNSTENLNSTSNNTLNDLNIVNDSKASQNDKENTNTEKDAEKLSDSSLNLIKELDNEQKREVCHYTNKSMTALETPNSFKTHRQRTKSLTAISKSEINDSAFFSDNEKTKKKVKKNKSPTDLNLSEQHFASGDNRETKQMVHQLRMVYKDIMKDKLHKSDFEILPSEINGEPIFEVSTNLSLKSISKEVLDVNALQGSKEKNLIMNIEEEDPPSNEMFSKNPSCTSLRSTVLLEESDTGTNSQVISKTFNSEDQCVPVVESIENCENSDNTKRLNTSVNNMTEEAEAESQNSLSLNKKEHVSCEPMDIDVTVPNNTLISENSQLNISSGSPSRKSDCQAEDLNKISSNLSHKSSPSHSIENRKKSESENKSTLIISQLKDLSSTENSLSKSPRSHQELLSKSTPVITNDNAVDKTNLSLDYSTSTPLQQKFLNKIGMQINTSLIEVYKNEIMKSNNSKKNISKSTEIDSSYEEESDTENSSRTKSLLDVEADVASDDYESGDSQDEEERQYEAENEILEKGETLDSEDDFSNDTDYEKDSFVVSANEEDLDLLSGSGDDLAMSDNELTMNKKSKKKYDDRKIKEQKKASKEMYEARHKLDRKKSKTKQSQINSSDDSEDEVAPKKQYKHRRINSSGHDSLDKSIANESSIKKKTKKRVLSESECNDSISKEQEITVFNNSVVGDDPLSGNLKQEPKTPLKDFNLSTVQIIDKIEETEVQNNVSFSKTNQTSDPLYVSMADEQSSSLSENSEIINNYDSVLKQLNNDHTKSETVKSLHTSINIDQKSKKNKTPILDELNLTHTKKSKTSKNIDIDVVDASQTKFEKTNKNQSQLISNEESSSDAIDLHLLFSEDSNDCDTDKAQTQIEIKKDSVDNFIPLKRTPGKTNITNEQDNEESTNSEIKFIIDTEGSKQSLDDSYNNTSSNSTTKKKKKSLNISNSQELLTNAVDTSSSASTKKKKKHFLTHENSIDVTAAETSLGSHGKKKKNLSESQLEKSEPNAATISPAIRDSVKKKKKHSESQLEYSDAVDTSSSSSTKKNKKHSLTHENPIDVTAAEMSPGSHGKKKKNLSESQLEETEPNAATICPAIRDSVKKKKKHSESQLEHSDALDTSSSSSTKKKKKHSLTHENPIDVTAAETSPGSHGKKKKNISESQLEETEPNSATISPGICDSVKKKKKHSESQLEHSDALDTSSSSSTKKKKKHSLTHENPIDVTAAETSLGSHGKKKKNLSESQLEETDFQVYSNLDQITKYPKKQKQQKTLNLSSQTSADEIPMEVISNTKKRKRKSSSNNDGENIINRESGEIAVVSETLDVSLSAGREKKKRKISQTKECDEIAVVPETLDASLSAGREKKKRKISQNDTTGQSNDKADFICEQNKKPGDNNKQGSLDAPSNKEEGHGKKNKKRKRHDDDNNSKAAKKLKEKSFDTVHVPRLPPSILSQLDDKPNKTILDLKKSKVISTTSFVVETKTRKNKPSVYLEESVYLNDSNSEKKPKKSLKKPKVLPFVPTAATSECGFTTKFQINVIPQEVHFVAKSTNVPNFRNDYLYELLQTEFICEQA
ncbi:hypothetical protein evm_002868 [Chilo suppressalis]|nr:hypothetical protein evm_002868 [Chilo suppressalis]